jgi:hypothetical protein
MSERIPLASLTLSRKAGQSVEVVDEHGNLIGRVVMNRAGQGRASIRFEFPRNVRLVRGELFAAAPSPVERNLLHAADSN